MRSCGGWYEGPVSGRRPAQGRTPLEGNTDYAEDVSRVGISIGQWECSGQSAMATNTIVQEQRNWKLSAKPNGSVFAKISSNTFKNLKLKKHL